MPTTFEDREQGFEAKFARDEELRFRIQARRDKLFAAWAATELRLSADTAAALLKATLAIPDGPSHDKAMLRQMAETFAAQRRAASPDVLQAALLRCARQAREQLMAG